MPAIDFITAFGRLLREGSLRDAFVVNPQAVVARLNLTDDQRVALLQLIPEDLEFQARVLLRKRLDIVRRIVPKSCRRLGMDEWKLFNEYARSRWDKETDTPVRDAYYFCCHIEQTGPHAVEPAEWNRLRFLLGGKRFVTSFVRRNSCGITQWPALQILIRGHRNRRHEFILSIKL